MGANRKAAFLDGGTFDLAGCCISGNLVALHYANPQENLTGFKIVNADEEVVFDGSDYKYRWDVLDQKPNVIYYTNDPDPDYRQTEPWPDPGDVREQAEPLSNEELTEAVADLMYEVSMMQLGI